MVIKKRGFMALMVLVFLSTVSKVEAMKRREVPGDPKEPGIFTKPTKTPPSSPRSRRVNDENVEDPFNKGLAYYDRQEYFLALKCFYSAANYGHPEALGSMAHVQNRIGFLYTRQKNYSEAKKWFGWASENGNGCAFFNLGLMHQRGQGTPKDFKQSFKCFSEALIRGHPKAEKAIKKMKSEFYKELKIDMKRVVKNITL